MDFKIAPEEIKTVAKLEEAIKEHFLIVDDGLIRVMCASVIANRIMSLDPVWLMIVAGSGGGKSEMLRCLNKLDFIHPISDLTVNTFASGQKRVGKETSLLLKINNGIMSFKDFTSILSKGGEAKIEIMKQLREIYDGEYVKQTGTGDSIKWKGKIGAIAGVTEAIYGQLRDMSKMGDRFIMYSMKQPDRMEGARKSFDNTRNIAEIREYMGDCFKHYIQHILKNIDEDEIEVSDSMRDDLLIVADFATRLRSAVETDFKTGIVEFVPALEMPMRVTAQLRNIGLGLKAMKQIDTGDKSIELDDVDKKILYKTAFDSIPRNRRDVLYPMAMYKQGVTSKGLAMKLELPTPSVTKQLSYLNALGVCSRKAGGGKMGDEWHIKEEFRNVLVNLKQVEVIDKKLVSDEEDETEENLIDQAFDSRDKDEAEQASLDINNPFGMRGYENDLMSG